MIKLMQYSFFKNCQVEEKLSKFVLENRRLSMGPITEEFESKFATWHRRKYCVMVNSGSSANIVLLSSLLNLGILKKGDQIGVNSVTWSTNIMPLIQLGLKPILIDVGEKDLNITKEQVTKVINNIKGLFITNVLGLDNELVEIANLCQEKGKILLEDNCEGLGCVVSKKLFGNFGLASTSSSFVGHHFSTIEGGYIFTDDQKLYAMLKVVRAHGWTRNLSDEEKILLSCKVEDEFNNPYTFEYCGFNVRPSEINAYCGLLQLDHIKFFNKIREDRFIKAAKRLTEFIYKGDTCNPVFAIPIRAKSKNHKKIIVDQLKSKNIESRPIISRSMGIQPFWIREYGMQTLDNSKEIDELGFYVTNDPQLADEDFGYLIDVLEEVLNN